MPGNPSVGNGFKALLWELLLKFLAFFLPFFLGFLVLFLLLLLLLMLLLLLIFVLSKVVIWLLSGSLFNKTLCRTRFLSHEHSTSSPIEQALAIVYEIPAAVIAFTKAVSRVSDGEMWDKHHQLQFVVAKLFLFFPPFSLGQWQTKYKELCLTRGQRERERTEADQLTFQQYFFHASSLWSAVPFAITKLIFTFTKAQCDAFCDFFQKRRFVATILAANLRNFVWHSLSFLAHLHWI